ncbi:MAG TPA: type VI secretion system baseplate subunit TssK [Terriglobales bacterium]|nr:type VI secretion system baseplate subunit TssK [Terriglobales bacterium]
MKQLQPVIWTKGTFLTPQHLQVQDRFIEDTLNFRLQALKFCPWGFSQLTLDQEQLAAGHLLVSRASGIFPDGLLFDIPDSDPAPASKALEPFFEPGVNNVDVYLAIPDYRQRGLNVAVAQRNGDTRYLAEVTAFRDENTGVSEKPVQVARKNLRLLAAEENRQGTSALRIANVEKIEGDTYRLNPHFVPPLLDVRASEYLSGVLRGIIEILSAKSTQLSSTRRQKNQSLADFTASDIANFWLLYTVNSYFPLFNYLFEAKQAHPEELYSAMVELAGSLTTFSPKLRPKDLPLYDHDNLGKIFSDLDEKLRSMLETVVPTNLVSLPLKLTQPSIYATALSDDKYLVNTRMYLAVSAETSEEVVIGKVPQLVKVCSATHIDHLVKQALPGVVLKHLPTPPSAIPVKLKYQYFSVNQSGAAWEAVRRARNFAAYVPGDFPNPQLELLILLPQEN